MIQQLNTFDRLFNFLLVIIVGASLALILASNPNLIKGQSLAETSTQDAQHEKVFVITPGERAIEEQTPQKPFSARQFNRKFLRVQMLDRALPGRVFKGWDEIDRNIWVTHSDSRTLSKYNFYFEEIFSLKLPEGQKLLDFKVFEDMLLVGSETGQLYLFDLLSNKVIWSHRLLTAAVKQVFFSKGGILAFTQDTDSEVKLHFIEASTGDIKKSQTLSFSIKNFLNLADLDALLVSNDTQIAKIKFDGTVAWKYEHSSKTTPVLYKHDDLVLFGDEENKVLALDYDSGEFKWDYKLRGKMVASPTWIPKHKDFAILTDNNYLHLIEKNGKGKWYFNTHNESESQHLTTFRLSNKLIDELSLKWVHEGWVVLSPCAKERLCIFNPENGAILSRLNVKSNFKEKPLFLPKQDSFYLMVLNPTGPKNLYEGDEPIENKEWGVAEMMELELFKERFKEYKEHQRAQAAAKKAEEEAKKAAQESQEQEEKAQENSTQPTEPTKKIDNSESV